MSNWIYTACALGFAAAVYAFFRRSPQALVVLCYEKIGRAPKKSRLKQEWTLVKAVEHTLKTLAKRGFTTIAPKDLNTKQQPAKPILLAFMGGYQSFYTDVFPLLQRYKAKACVFLAQEYVGAYNAWQNPYLESWQNLLTEKQLKELAASGLVSFGAVDLKARDITRLPAEEARFGLEENLFRLREQLGLTPQAAACWPAKKWNKKTAPEILGGLDNLPILTPVTGVNPAGKNGLLKTIYPAKNPWRARWALWTHR